MKSNTKLTISALITVIFSNPGITTQELSKHFGCRTLTVYTKLKALEGKVITGEKAGAGTVYDAMWSIRESKTERHKELSKVLEYCVEKGFIEAEKPKTEKKPKAEAAEKPKADRKTTHGAGAAKVRTGNGLVFKGESLGGAVEAALSHFQPLAKVGKVILHAAGSKMFFHREEGGSWYCAEASGDWPERVYTVKPESFASSETDQAANSPETGVQTAEIVEVEDPAITQKAKGSKRGKAKAA
jgi:hypothetical protein